MPLPTLIRVVGTGENPDQTVGKGSVRFRAVALVSDGDSNFMLPGDVIASFDSLGELDVQVPASNDPGWAPVGWTWLISLSVDGHPRLDWYAVVPYNAPGGEIGLGDLTPIPTADGELYALYSHTHPQYALGADLDALETIVAGLGTPPDLSTYATNAALASGLAGKADLSAMTTALGLKADASAVTSALALKADTSSLSAYALASALTSGLALKAPLASPTFTGTVAGITATMVGLPNVDNTSDANKPVSTATTTALGLKADLAGPTFTGVPAAPTAAPGVNTTQLATTAFVAALGALKANLAGPTFTGTPTLPTGTIATTQTAGNSTTALATTAFVTTADNLKANLAGPTFTGVPAAPTAAGGTNTTQMATTAFVAAAAALLAPLASPTLTGVPAAPTATPGTNTTQLATTAFAAAIAALKADLASPALTGTPTAPTAAPGVNTTQIATTAYVTAADGLDSYTAALGYDESQIAKRGYILPTDHGLGGWTFPPDGVQAGTILPTSGVSHIVRVKAMGATVNNIIIHLTAGGSTLTSGQCFATLHNDAGAILGAGAVTADQSTAWASGGTKVMALTVAQGVTPGNWYKVRFWFVGTTGPTLSRGVNSSSAITNMGLVAPNFRYGTADTGLTTAVLAPNNIGTITGGATAWWVGLS